MTTCIVIALNCFILNPDEPSINTRHSCPMRGRLTDRVTEERQQQSRPCNAARSANRHLSDKRNITVRSVALTNSGILQYF